MDVQMKIIQCANCHIPFAVPSRFEEDMRGSHESFFCPKGHKQYFPGKTDEEKLKEKLRKKDQELSEKLKELNEARTAAEQLRVARIEMIEKTLNELFKKEGTNGILVKAIAPTFGLKTRELYDLVSIHMPNFKCVRAGNGYAIVKNKKEKK